MSTVVATNASTAPALGRLHSAKRGVHHPATRPRSSSLADKEANPPFLTSPMTSSSSPLTISNKLPMTNDSLKGLHLAHHHLGDDLDRINQIPSALNQHTHRDSDNSRTWSSRPSSPRDQNSDIPIEQTQGNVPALCTGRSRSNTLDSVDLAEASITDQLDHVMRPRRPSLAHRPSGPIIHSISSVPTIVLPNTDPSNDKNSTPSHSYPPMPLLPQYHSMEETKEDIQITAQSTVSSLPRINMQLGFLSRIVILIGLFGMSLGGLYLLAQVLPPLSLPKSIDDVKVDAAILQEFATATYEGWIRTFWVFSVVYMWKQCFGIPGSAFLNILAGALYGPWFGTVLTSLLTTLGSVLAYFMSFFLMEPIMNRYASGSLEQMRLQIQKKAMRSSSSKRSSSQDSSATSTAVQSSITSTDLSMSTSSSAIAAASISSSPSALRGGLLRTRSSSITTRVTDRMEQREISSIYSKTPSTGATVPAYQNVHDENDMQEGKGLLSEERTVDSSILSVAQQVVVEVAHSSIAVEEDEDDQDDSEGTSLFMQLLLIRLFPLTPYWFINLASPLVGVPVIPFMTSMFLGCMPYNYICAQAGAILSEIHELRDIYQQPWILFQIVVVLLLSTVAVLISKRTKKKQLDMEQQRKSRSSEEESANDESTHHLLQSDRHRPSIDSPQDNIAMSSLNPRDSVIEVY